MNLTEIENAAVQLREILGIEPAGRVQMINLIETVLPEVLPDYLFSVLPDDEMPGMDGLTAIGSFTICLAEHTYVELSRGDPEARMTAAHELGHLILHSHQAPALARRNHEDDRVDPEWQADRFAEVWLMPSAGITDCATVADIVARFTVPEDAARRRLDRIRSAQQKIQGELF